jgi:hypothetical protein
MTIIPNPNEACRVVYPNNHHAVKDISLRFHRTKGGA